MSSRKKPEDLGDGDANYDPRSTGGPTEGRPLSQSGNQEQFIPAQRNEATPALLPASRHNIQPVQYDTESPVQSRQDAHNQYAQQWVPQLHYGYSAEEQPGYEPEATPAPRDEPNYQSESYPAYGSQAPEHEYIPSADYGRYAHRSSAAAYGPYQHQMPRVPPPPVAPEDRLGAVEQGMARLSLHHEAYKQFPSLVGEIELEENAQGQTAPVNGLPKITTNAWESENTLYISVEVAGHVLTRRLDNNLINGTKLLNYTGITRGRRDGILKQEKVRHVIRIGNQNLKGVWIPFERAYELAKECGQLDSLYPLFLADMGEFLYGAQNLVRTQQVVRSAQQHNPNFERWMYRIPPIKRTPEEDSDNEEEYQHYRRPPLAPQQQQQYAPIPDMYGRPAPFGTQSYDRRNAPVVRSHSSSMHSRRQSGHAVPRSHRRQYSIEKARPTHDMRPSSSDRYSRPSAYLAPSMPSSSEAVGPSSSGAQGAAAGLGILSEFGNQDYATSQQYYTQQEYPAMGHMPPGPYQHMQERLPQGSGQPLIQRPPSQQPHQPQHHHQQQQPPKQ